MSVASAERVLGSSVLVLNRYFMPVHVVGVRRAFAMLYRELAEVIEIEAGQFTNYDLESWMLLGSMRDPTDTPEHVDWIRTVHHEVQVPRIIRLMGYDRVPRQTLRFNRRNLFARDNHSCQYCGLTLPVSQLSVDHVIPRSRGGATSWENVVCSCLDCNTKKGGRTPQEARMRLLSQPKRPNHNPLLALKLSNPKYQSWKTFFPTANWVGDPR